MKTNILLTPEQILKATQANEELPFPNDFDLIYEKQFLPGVVILLEGELQIIKTRILKRITVRGSVIGWENIRKKRKSNYKLRIKAGSRILLIGRSGMSTLEKIIINEESKAEICS